MTLLDMQLQIADNLNMVTADGTIRDGRRVTGASILRRLQTVYRERLWPVCADQWPEDSQRETYPISTYTASGTASASSTASTLIATTNIFDNYMEGFTVYNATDNTSATISKYVSATQVTLNVAINDTWDGDTIYVLGNVYQFNGDTTDLRELRQIAIKYAPSDTTYTIVTLRDYKDVVQSGDEVFTKVAPMAYRTTVTVGNSIRPAVGILPFPDNYQGQLYFIYIAKPKDLGSTDEPLYTNAGICECLIAEVTAWGLQQQERYTQADRWKADAKQLLTTMLLTYKPRSRSGPTKWRLSTYYEAQEDRLL